jgi:release factor glutamine methyltransferase
VKKVKEILEIYKNELRQTLYDSREIEAIFYILLEHLEQISKIDSLLNPLQKVNEQNLLLALQKLKKGTPWQYILGYTFFKGLKLKVNNDVLIPRPETEELVEWIINENKEITPVKILDIGTGSGAIAIALAKAFPEAQIFAMDISPEALKIAKENAKENKVNIHFFEQNILEIKKLDINFDIMVSNPPYVREQEKKWMKKNVLDFEPSLALFVPDYNPLIFYENILELFINNRSDAKLYFEINEFLKTELENLLKKKGLNQFVFKKDIFDKWRMLRIDK